MKQIYILLALCVSLSSTAQITEIFISKYGEGSSSNKFLEIYNGTSATINLDNYAFATVANAPSVPGEYEFWQKFTPGATIAPGDVYILADGQADPAILAETDMTFEFLSNGDDGLALVLDNGTWNDADGDGEVGAGEMTGFTILDWLGDWNADPGSGWEVSGVANATQNGTLTRKSSVCGPNNDWDSSRGFDASTMATTAAASEWIVTGSDTGWGTLGSFSGCSTTPVVTITSPADGAVLNAGPMNVDIVFSAQNAPATSTFDIDVDGTVTTGVTSPFSIPVQNGASYTVTVSLIDGGSSVASDTTNFSIAFPCDLQVGTITETCQTSTSGVDLYDVTIDFTGGGTTTYTIDTAGNGTVGGDDPSTAMMGQITITGVTEGTNFTVTFTGDATNSSCNFTRSITSPSCIGTITCANPGDIIITEIMQNPSAVGDSAGEYFEIYNTTAAPISLQGWEIKDDVTASETHTISNLTVPANGYAVLGINSDATTNGGVTVDYQYNTINLSNGADGIILECSATIIDQVIYDGGTTFPDPNGISMELAASAFDATSNDLGSNWGESTGSISGGDAGTPGAANTFTLSNESFENASLKLYPNPVSTGSITIETNTGETVDVTIFSALGQRMISQKDVANTIDISSLNSGLYLVRISQNGATQTRKLVVQ